MRFLEAVARLIGGGGLLLMDRGEAVGLIALAIVVGATAMWAYKKAEGA